MPQRTTAKLKKERPRAVPRISDAEWVVMKVLWDQGPLTTNEVVEALDPETHWKPKTIHTLLSRLARKGALKYERQGREYLFSPLVSAAECDHALAQSLLSRFLGGELAPFLARFIEQAPLTPAEIAELKRILDGKS